LTVAHGGATAEQGTRLGYASHPQPSLLKQSLVVDALRAFEAHQGRGFEVTRRNPGLIRAALRKGKHVPRLLRSAVLVQRRRASLRNRGCALLTPSRGGYAKTQICQPSGRPARQSVRPVRLRSCFGRDAEHDVCRGNGRDLHLLATIPRRPMFTRLPNDLRRAKTCRTRSLSCPRGCQRVGQACRAASHKARADGGRGTALFHTDIRRSTIPETWPRRRRRPVHGGAKHRTGTAAPAPT